MAILFNKDTSLARDYISSANMKEIPKSIGDKINLREELDGILFGSTFMTSKGHVVKLVHNDTTKPNNNYDPVFKESKTNGSFESFIQYPICYRARPWMTPYNEQVLSLGINPSDAYIYYFRYDVTLSTSDFIYEYDNIDGKLLLRDIINLVPKERYNIKFIDDRRGDYGRIEYYRVVAILDGGHIV